MKIYLPNSAFLGNIDPFLKGFDNTEPGILEVHSNKRWISVHPVVLAMAASLGLRAGEGNIRFEPLEARSKHYLERMGLFKILGIESDIQIVEHEPAGRFIPLAIVKESSELTNFLTEMVPLLHLEPAEAQPIRFILSELIRNVLEHSESPMGAILCAQYYKKSNTIRIGIVDTGIGIKRSICRSHPASTHLEAIKLALTPGITGATSREGGTEQNAGAGLFFIKSIAKVNRDFFIIYSGDSMYKLLKTGSSNKFVRLYSDPFDDKHSTHESLPFWEGTVVGIDISLDSNQEFSKLLDMIRKTFTKTIRERKKDRYRRPKFI